MRQMQNLPPWQGSPELSFQNSRITSRSGARASARYHLGLSTGDWLVQERSLFGLVNDWREYLTEGDEHHNTNYELHLGIGQPLGSADFVEKLEKLNRYEFAAQEGWLAEGQEKEMKYTVPGNPCFNPQS